MIRHFFRLSTAAALFTCGQVMAQGVAAPAQAAIASPEQPVANGHGLHWPSQDQRAALPVDREVAMAIFAWTPVYRVSVLRRAPNADPARARPEMHEDKTQIYFIVSGSATQVLGGKPFRETSIVDGNHSGDGPLADGRSFHIAAGDIVVIPPHTWHQTLPDAGQMLVYQMVDVKTPTRMP